jgi:hypothetical protein
VGQQLGLQLEAGVIGAEVDAHAAILPNRRPGMYLTPASARVIF